MATTQKKLGRWQIIRWVVFALFQVVVLTTEIFCSRVGANTTTSYVVIAGVVTGTFLLGVAIATRPRDVTVDETANWLSASLIPIPLAILGWTSESVLVDWTADGRQMTLGMRALLCGVCAGVLAIYAGFKTFSRVSKRANSVKTEELPSGVEPSLTSNSVRPWLGAFVAGTTILSIVLTAGLTPLFSYTQPLLDWIDGLAAALHFRLLLTVSVLGFIALVAWSDGVGRDPASGDDWKSFENQDESRWGAIRGWVLEPVFFFVRLSTIVLGVVWRIVQNVLDIVRSVFWSVEACREYLRILLIWFVCVGIPVMARAIAPIQLRYMLADTRVVGTDSPLLDSLSLGWTKDLVVLVIGYGAMSLVVAVTLLVSFSEITGERTGALHSAAQVQELHPILAAAILAIGFSGPICHAVPGDSIAMLGHDGIGLLSMAFLVLLGIMVVWSLATGIRGQQPASVEDG